MHLDLKREQLLIIGIDFIRTMTAGTGVPLLATRVSADLRFRFTDHQLGYSERNQHLVALMQTYLATMADLGVETWVMHGTLLGWWWNKKVGSKAALSIFGPDS